MIVVFPAPVAPIKTDHFPRGCVEVDIPNRPLFLSRITMGNMTKPDISLQSFFDNRIGTGPDLHRFIQYFQQTFPSGFGLGIGVDGETENIRDR